jgi:tripartite-type tricarboxylate transporter receptor subunit TctC
MKRFIAAATLLFAGTAAAQTYPTKPVRIIFPATAGSLFDGFARAMSIPLSESFGQQVIVENRPGASTTIGMSACAKSPPDGYTICTAVPDSLTYNPLLFTNLPYDPDNDFVPVSNMLLVPAMLAAHPSAPFRSMKELIAYAKANPGKVNWGTWGPATIPEVLMNWVKHHASVDITGVPYKGGGQAWPALIAGETHITFIGLHFGMPQVKAGKAVPVAVTSAKRNADYPAIPSMFEDVPDTGLGDTWYGMFLPAKAPRALVDRLHAEVVKGLQHQKVQAFMKTNGIEPVGSSPQEFADHLKRERAAAARVFKTIGLKAGTLQ